VTAAPDFFQLPASDDLMPGAGPVRRADWFLPIWAARREHFFSRREQDKNALVFLGDSITGGWGDDFGGHFPGSHLANRGIGGDTTRGMLYRLPEDVVALQPRGVVILAGTNDLEENADTAATAENVRSILAALHHADAQLPVVLCEIFPSTAKHNRPPHRIQALNRLYREIASGDSRITLVETWSIFADANGDAREEEFPDLLHPNHLGYAKWAGALNPALRALGLI
jgi:lysophospholipase L1-like esterase